MGLVNRRFGRSHRMARNLEIGPVSELTDCPNHLVDRILGVRPSTEWIYEHQPNRHAVFAEDVGDRGCVMRGGRINPSRLSA